MKRLNLGTNVLGVGVISRFRSTNASCKSFRTFRYAPSKIEIIVHVESRGCGDRVAWYPISD
jgi:hypothetical protein